MGAETRIAVAEDIVLDFAGLFSPIEGEKQAPESPTEPLLRAGEYKTITEPQKPAERLTEGLEGQQAKKLYLDTQREREDRQRSFSALLLWTLPRDSRTPGLPLTATASETIPHGI